ncbi:MAG: GNAT family N-acetyltransferase [Sandaracinus sp.]
MRIREITKADYDFVVSVLDRWWGGPSRELAHPLFYYELGREALIAEIDGEVAGFLFGFHALSHDPPEPNRVVAYIHMVGIHPDHRRRGVGKHLYERFTERARVAGAVRLKAITNVGNEGSIDFHRALGFEVIEDPDYAGTSRARIVFTKELFLPA